MNPAPDPVALRRIASRIDGAKSVTRRSGGVAGTVSSYFPGERLLGIKGTNDGRLVIHVVMRWGSTVDEVEEDVMAAIGTDWPSGPIDITVDDIEFSQRQSMPGAGQAALLDANGPRQPSRPDLTR